MSDNMSIAILGKDIPISESMIDIDCLLYNQDNPRVYSVLYGKNVKKNENQNIQQEAIYEVMIKQPSVEKIKQDIDNSGGLLEPILIRHDTMQVIEGNSRLTVYKFLHAKNPHEEKWKKISCRSVSSLTEEQQDYYLNSIHIKGKTKWSAYEKANFIYRRFNNGVSIDELGTRFSETENEIRKRIETIEMMVDNKDNKQDNFAYYDVLRRNQTIYNSMQNKPDLKKVLLNEIKNNSKKFTAMHLREKLPTILDNKKHTKKFIQGKDLDDVYKAVKKSMPDSKLRLAIRKMKEVTKHEIYRLEIADVNKLEYTLRNIRKEYDRIHNMIKQYKE